ncbi:YdcF family protein [Streptomonospora sp. S1-112]|uniref:YdcF family protein n=1 Tax=Streptomonospora mangrovi TaxID=2883123 RepID=A0A9X3SCY2_9ACTN|nr:YdcF family protein [Streptomonospora mangrovi]MDA0563262.1 YdcF family protein [Streptomonospora mangrovi]
MSEVLENLEELGGEVHALARVLWDFHTRPVCDPVPGAGNDLILVLGSHDVRVAGHAARMWRQGVAPLVVISGDRGRRTGGDGRAPRWERSEAHVFADAARAAAPIPDSALLLETGATNTGENFTRSRALVEAAGIPVRRAVVTAKPYMAQRALATAAVHWPSADWTFACFGGGYTGYCADPEHTAEELVHFLVGDLQRLAVYAGRGWSAPVEVPEEAWRAAERLAALGFTDHLVPGEPVRPLSR